MRIEITRTAKKDLERLDNETKNRILKGLLKFQENPETADTKKLAGKPVRWRL